MCFFLINTRIIHKFILNKEAKLKKNIIIDIGANFGVFTFDAAKKNPNIKFIAIEPIKECIEHLKKYSYANVEIVEKCISKVNGFFNLNINSTAYDLGLTSLLELSDDIRDNNYWRSRKDVIQPNIKKKSSRNNNIRKTS